MWNCIEKLQELGVAVICHSALPSEMVVVVGYEFTEGHPALRTLLQQLDYVSRELRKMLGQQRTAAQPAEF